MAGDDGTNTFKLYRYDPSLAAAIIFVVLFALVSFLHTYQLLRTRTWYFIPFVLGGYCTLLSCCLLQAFMVLTVLSS